MKRFPSSVLATAVAVFAALGQGCSQQGDSSGSTGGSSASSASRGDSSQSSNQASSGTGGSNATTSASGGTGGSGGAGGAGGSAPPTCNGYEPCGVNPVVIPDGYTLSEGLTVFNQSTNTNCQDFSDCDMWNTHFDMMWTPPDNGWNRMGSPFPWINSRYYVVVPPNRITYAKLHMSAPNEPYLYSDGTPEMYTDPTTHATTCYARGPGHMTLGWLGNMGGTGNAGFVDWNISVLPGDMGNSGNTSTCQGSGATTTKLVTSDEATAEMKGPDGKYTHCLLREGQDYYVNFMSHGQSYSVDCSTDDCTIGTFQFTNPVTSDGSEFVVKVACP